MGDAAGLQCDICGLLTLYNIDRQLWLSLGFDGRLAYCCQPLL